MAGAKLFALPGKVDILPTERLLYRFALVANDDTDFVAAEGLRCLYGVGQQR